MQPTETAKTKSAAQVDEDGVSEEDIQAAMSAAIEEKKKEKFNKMIERGSKIAAQQQEQALDQLVTTSISTQ